MWAHSHLAAKEHAMLGEERGRGPLWDTHGQHGAVKRDER